VICRQSPAQSTPEPLGVEGLIERSHVEFPFRGLRVAHGVLHHTITLSHTRSPERGRPPVETTIQEFRIVPCTGSGRMPSGDHRCEQGNSQQCTHDTIVPDRVECRDNIGAILSSRRRRVQRLVSPRRGPRAAFAWRIHGFR
jgi:hypothetical protein